MNDIDMADIRRRRSAFGNKREKRRNIHHRDDRLRCQMRRRPSCIRSVRTVLQNVLF